MTVYAITDTKKGEQGLRLLIFKLSAYGLCFRLPDEYGSPQATGDRTNIIGNKTFRGQTNSRTASSRTRRFADKPIRGQDDSRTGRFADNATYLK